ncbi:hypothetical protein Y900_025530 [Mycolicibacterium aromaticivorans JS19b1 = JCM 16368]|uniref:Uncharacterized protein n=1 Tax=Mycolicibacterium aromaticivorans JS19b1 = JCM 16368 TaxID=1440774 RepID=A0A064CPC6_9MYCO|nr:hypothetical protein [Mycolicibacterium aromaticivorans]KDF02201.1 hypothetical protein Y900_025530 [Mycolicibacterium aromaticivorans JS19b1 = JCM 16368]
MPTPRTEVAEALGSYAALSQHRPPNHPDVIAARHRLHAARLEREIRRNWPLDDADRQRLIELLGTFSRESEVLERACKPFSLRGPDVTAQ